MKNEQINLRKKHLLESDQGWIFREDGEYAEMSMDLADYIEKTSPIPNAEFHFSREDITTIKEAVSIVADDWVQYFNKPETVFCGYLDGKLASFCLVYVDDDFLISHPRYKVGTIGCVGTLPEFRRRGIGMRMIDLATVYLRAIGCDKSYISYTDIDPWYAKLGYETFARFSFE